MKALNFKRYIKTPYALFDKVSPRLRDLAGYVLKSPEFRLDSASVLGGSQHFDIHDIATSYEDWKSKSQSGKNRHGIKTPDSEYGHHISTAKESKEAYKLYKKLGGNKYDAILAYMISLGLNSNDALDLFKNTITRDVPDYNITSLEKDYNKLTRKIKDNKVNISGIEVNVASGVTVDTDKKDVSKEDIDKEINSWKASGGYLTTREILAALKATLDLSNEEINDVILDKYPNLTDYKSEVSHYYKELMRIYYEYLNNKFKDLGTSKLSHLKLSDIKQHLPKINWHGCILVVSDNFIREVCKENNIKLDEEDNANTDIDAKVKECVKKYEYSLSVLELVTIIKIIFGLSTDEAKKAYEKAQGMSVASANSAIDSHYQSAMVDYNKEIEKYINTDEYTSVEKIKKEIPNVYFYVANIPVSDKFIRDVCKKYDITLDDRLLKSLNVDIAKEYVKEWDFNFTPAEKMAGLKIALGMSNDQCREFSKKEKIVSDVNGVLTDNSINTHYNYAIDEYGAEIEKNIDKSNASLESIKKQIPKLWFYAYSVPVCDQFIKDVCKKYGINLKSDKEELDSLDYDDDKDIKKYIKELKDDGSLSNASISVALMIRYGLSAEESLKASRASYPINALKDIYKDILKDYASRLPKNKLYNASEIKALKPQHNLYGIKKIPVGDLFAKNALDKINRNAPNNNPADIIEKIKEFKSKTYIEMAIVASMINFGMSFNDVMNTGIFTSTSEEAIKSLHKTEEVVKSLYKTTLHNYVHSNFGKLSQNIFPKLIITPTLLISPNDQLKNESKEYYEKISSTLGDEEGNGQIQLISKDSKNYKFFIPKSLVAFYPLEKSAAIEIPLDVVEKIKKEMIESNGSKKISLIKMLRALIGTGLKATKELVEFIQVANFTITPNLTRDKNSIKNFIRDIANNTNATINQIFAYAMITFGQSKETEIKNKIKEIFPTSAPSKEIALQELNKAKITFLEQNNISYGPATPLYISNLKNLKLKTNYKPLDVSDEFVESVLSYLNTISFNTMDGEIYEVYSTTTIKYYIPVKYKPFKLNSSVGVYVKLHKPIVDKIKESGNKIDGARRIQDEAQFLTNDACYKLCDFIIKQNTANANNDYEKYTINGKEILITKTDVQHIIDLLKKNNYTQAATTLKTYYSLDANQRSFVINKIIVDNNIVKQSPPTPKKSLLSGATNKKVLIGGLSFPHKDKIKEICKNNGAFATWNAYKKAWEIPLSLMNSVLAISSDLKIVK